MLGVGLIGIQYRYQHWYRYEIDANAIDTLVSVPCQPSRVANLSPVPRLDRPVQTLLLTAPPPALPHCCVVT